MSLNKVLNRPLFRQQALRKGALKPIHAESGRMIGMNVPGGVQNYIQKDGGFYDAKTGRLVGGLPAKINTTQSPSWWSKFKSDVGGVGRNWRDPRFLLSAPFGMGGGATRTAGAFGLYPLIEEGTRKLGLTGYSKLAADAAISMGLSKNPYAAGIGLLYGGYRASRPLVGRAVDLAKEKPLGTTASNKDFMPGIEGALGDPIKTVSFEEMVKNNKGAGRWTSRDPSQTADSPPPQPIPENMKQIASGRGSGTPRANVGYREFDNAVAGIEPPDQLTQPENETRVGNSTVVDLEKIVKNASLSEDENIEAPKDEGLVVAPGMEPSKPPAPVKEAAKPKRKKLQAEQDASDIVKKQSPFAKQIEMAREIQSELLQGRSSVAKQVFLSQLAAGLMSGTTRKSGIGGALEVFGQALGPASNNYAVMKLKENELENKLMSDALEMSSDFLKAQNSVMADAQDHGFVKIIGAEGQLRNMAAKRLKDGTIQVAVPGQVDANGAQLFTTVPYGSYTGFVKGDFAASEQNKTLKNLSGAYKGLQFNQINLKILRSAKANDKVLAGPVGKLKLLTNRVSGAANDFNFSLGSSDKDAKDFFENNFLSEGNLKSYADEEGLSIDEAEKKLRSDFEKNKNKYKKDLEKYVKPSSQSESAQLEELAINQTITVYALANALKSKDRLTQKDIENAERLVNIFPGFKGQDQVIQSLEAIEKTLLKDIERIEGDYVDADFGDPVIIETYRRKFNIGGTGLIAPEAIIDKQASQGTLLQDFNK